MNSENVLHLIDSAAQRFPARIAIDMDKTQLTHGDLQDSANRLANCLTDEGLGRQGPVAILASDRTNVLVGMLAILKAGGAFVPIDPRLPKKRIVAMLSQVRPQLFLTETEYLGTLSELVGLGLPSPKVINLSSPTASSEVSHDSTVITEWRSYNPKLLTSLPNQLDDMCYVYFTSGSTGKPKGIAGRLKSIAHFVTWEIRTFGLSEGTRVSQFTSPSFDAVLRDFFVPLCCGGTICGFSTSGALENPYLLVKWMEDKQINLVHCVPSLLRLVMTGPVHGSSFQALKYILLAGESLRPSDVKKWVDLFGTRIQLINLYGPSETTMVKFCYPVKAEDQYRRSIPIGRPIEGSTALVVDNKGRPCPPGIIGEIYIRTPYRSLGYYNQPDLTAEAFVQNPFSSEADDIVYKTGDLGRLLSDGNFEFLGRKDRQIKVRGMRVELDEIENLLVTHESVKDAVVVNYDDETGNESLCAYVVERGKIDPTNLLDFVAASLPDYMVPSIIVVVKAIPRTLNGKVEYKALPAPPKKLAESLTAYAAPSNAVQQELANIWSQVLGIPHIGIHDNFFDLGGHSILAMQLLSRIRAVFNVDVTLRSLLEEGTVAKVAEIIGQDNARDRDVAPQLGPASSDAEQQGQ